MSKRPNKPPRPMAGFIFGRLAGSEGTWIFRKIEFWKFSWVLTQICLSFGWILLSFQQFALSFDFGSYKSASQNCKFWCKRLEYIAFSGISWLYFTTGKLKFPKNWVFDEFCLSFGKFLLEFWKNWVLVALSFDPNSQKKPTLRLPKRDVTCEIPL